MWWRNVWSRACGCARWWYWPASGAAEFGLFRVLMFVSMFSSALFQPGLTEALVQRKDITPIMSPPRGGPASIRFGGASALFAVPRWSPG